MTNEKINNNNKTSVKRVRWKSILFVVVYKYVPDYWPMTQNFQHDTCAVFVATLVSVLARIIKKGKHICWELKRNVQIRCFSLYVVLYALLPEVPHHNHVGHDFAAFKMCFSVRNRQCPNLTIVPVAGLQYMTASTFYFFIKLQLYWHEKNRCTATMISEQHIARPNNYTQTPPRQISWIAIG